MKRSRIAVTRATGCSNPNSGNDHNHPIDLAQKSHAVSEVNVKGGSTTMVNFETQIIPSINSPHGIECTRKDGSMSGTTVALVSRQSGLQVTGTTGSALNLVSPNPPVLCSSTTLRSVSHPSPALSVASCLAGSPPPSAHSGYHIPKGAAAVANMAASRSQGLTSIVRTSGQGISGINTSAINTPRGGLVGQRVVPITSGPTWTNRPTPASSVITSKLSTAAIPSRSNIASARSQSGTSATTHGSTLQKACTVSAGNIRSQTPGVRAAVSEVLRVQTPKGVHIAHPVPHAQKYITSGSNISGRGITSGSLHSPGSLNSSNTCQNLYTPSSTLVTSLASSGTTITPHPPIRPQAPAIPVRITSASPAISQGVLHSNAPLTAITMTTTSGTPTCGAILTHPGDMQQLESHHVPIKTPIVRNPMTNNHTKIAFGSVSGGTPIAFSGSKILTQGQQGSSTLTVAQIPNLPGVNQKVSPLSQTQNSSFISRGGRVSCTTSIPLPKVVPQGSVSGIGNPSNQATSITTTIASSRASHAHPVLPVSVAAQSNVSSTPASVVLHRAAHQGVTVPGLSITQGDRLVTTVPQYSITATPYYIESSQNSFSASLVTTNLGSSNHYVPTCLSSGANRVCGSNISGSTTTTASEAGSHPSNSITGVKQNSSPRPSILRKRPELEGMQLKAAKNLTHALSLPISSPPSPKRPDSRGNGNVSSGSATVSANSSPGIHNDDDSTGAAAFKNSFSVMKRDGLEDPGSIHPMAANRGSTHVPNPVCVTIGGSSAVVTGVPSFSHCSVPLNVSSPKDGMSPRKKPRKQKLMGNELQEVPNSEDDSENVSIKKFKKEIPFTQPSQPTEVVSPPIELGEEEKSSWSDIPLGVKNELGGEGPVGGMSAGSKLGSSSPEPVANTRPHMYLLNGYRQTWKSRHNHFIKYTDIRPKEEKKRTVNEIANQKLAFQKVNGWKVVHLSGQVEDLVELEGDVVERLRMLLSVIEKRNHDYEKDVNRLSELVKANLQRSKIIRDQMSDAKLQMSKIFDHKSNIVDIMNKYCNKRMIKKREKV